MIAGQHQLITTCTGGFGHYRITLESLHSVMIKSLGKHFSRSSVYIFIMLYLKQYQNVLFLITWIYLLVFNVMNCTIYTRYTQKLKMLQVPVTCLPVFMIDISFLECWCSTECLCQCKAGWHEIITKETRFTSAGRHKSILCQIFNQWKGEH